MDAVKTFCKYKSKCILVTEKLKWDQEICFQCIFVLSHSEMNGRNWQEVKIDVMEMLWVFLKKDYATTSLLIV